MNGLQFHEEFEHDYDVEELIETSGCDPQRYFYPGASLAGGKDGVMLKVVSKVSPPWIGVFSFGHATWDLTGVYATPCPAHVCVVARGSGYWVSALDPTKWEAIRALPITDVKSFVNRSLLIFADHTTLTAYDQNGCKWKTKSISGASEIKITDIEKDALYGEFWMDWPARRETFYVELDTGRYEVL
jgi:hypothetical protein